MATQDELFQQLMQAHNAKQTPGDVLQESLQKQQQPEEIDNWKNPNKLEDQLLYKIGQPIYEALTQTRPGAALLGTGEGVHQYLQSPLNMFRSPENRVGSLGTEELINPEHGGYHSGGKLAGIIGMDVLGMKGIAGLMRGMTGIKGLLSRMAATAGHNYATSEHFPEWLGGRRGAATIGGFFPVTAGATANEIGKNITAAGKNAMAKHGGEIGEAAGVAKSVTAPQGSIGIADIMAGKSGNHVLHEMDKTQEALKSFFSNPNGKTAQESLSVMKKAQRALTKGIPSNNPKHLGDRASAEYYALEDAIKEISASMKQGMSPKEWERYATSLQQYATEAAPYSNLFETGKASKYFPESIAKMEKGGKVKQQHFEHFMKKHPELWINKHFKKLGAGALTATGAYNAKDIMDYFGSSFGGGEHE